MKALVGAFNQKKALVGAFSVIVKTEGSFAALLSSLQARPGHQPHCSLAQDQQLQGQRQVCADQVRNLRQERLGQLPPAEGVHGNAGLQVWQQCQCRHERTCSIQLYKHLYSRIAVYSY